VKIGVGGTSIKTLRVQVRNWIADVRRADSRRGPADQASDPDWMDGNCGTASYVRLRDPAVLRLLAAAGRSARPSNREAHRRRDGCSWALPERPRCTWTPEWAIGWRAALCSRAYAITAARTPTASGRSMAGMGASLTISTCVLESLAGRRSCRRSARISINRLRRP